jgi:hypothetical protein
MLIGFQHATLASTEAAMSEATNKDLAKRWFEEVWNPRYLPDILNG